MAKRWRPPTWALLAAGVIAWLAAFSGWIASSLASQHALPQTVGWLVWPRGAGVYVRAAGTCVGLALLVWLSVRLSRRLWVTSLVVIAGLVVAVGAPQAPYPGPRALFDSMRPQLDAITTLPDVAGPVSPRHDVPLPRGLSAVAVFGYVSSDGVGGVFVPQWAALVDDAGGFWFTPGTSPDGRDMWGMTCTDPTRLDGDWWTCGMKLTAE
ncbi:MAG: hypothetical protein FWF90_09235 [Promicromonosporaceae bacterium]|nr:hypothetical protein [Promicromonosporaceae bacterium]